MTAPVPDIQAAAPGEAARHSRILAERTRLLASRRDRQESERPEPVLVLRAGNERFALRLRDAAEVSVSRAAALLPQGNPALVGLMDIRGTLCRVYDLARLCGLPGAAGGRPTGHVIRLRIDGSIGLLVERAEAMVDIPPAQLQPDPETPPGQIGRRILAGYTLIDPAALLSHPAIVEEA